MALTSACTRREWSRWSWPYEWPDPTGAKGEFRRALHEMVKRVWRRLEAMKDELDERRRLAQEAEKLAGAGQLVYLHARDEHREAWETTQTALLGDGFGVIPGEPEPVEHDAGDALTSARKRVRLLKKAMLRRFLADDGADARKYADATDHRHLKKCSRYARMRNAVSWHFVPKLRDELLGREIFYTLTEAQI